jgi:hypothetical protein
VEHGLGDVLGQHVHLQDIALAVEIFEFVRLYTVCGGALLAPARVSDPGPLQHSVRVDGVYSDALRPPSSARHRARCNSAAFAEEYADAFLPAAMEFLEATKTRLPPTPRGRGRRI